MMLTREVGCSAYKSGNDNLSPIDAPSIAAVAGYASIRPNHLPPSVVLPEKVYHSNSGMYSGQFAGLLGNKYEPWFIEATDKPHAYHSYSGAFPKYLFNLHKGEQADKINWRFEVPNLTLPEGVLSPRFIERQAILDLIEHQQRHLEQAESVGGYDRIRQSVISNT